MTLSLQSIHPNQRHHALRLQWRPLPAAKLVGVGAEGGLWRVTPEEAPCNVGMCTQGGSHGSVRQHGWALPCPACTIVLVPCVRKSRLHLPSLLFSTSGLTATCLAHAGGASGGSSAASPISCGSQVHYLAPDGTWQLAGLAGTKVGPGVWGRGVNGVMQQGSQVGCVCSFKAPKG